MKKQKYSNKSIKKSLTRLSEHLPDFGADHELVNAKPTF